MKIGIFGGSFNPPHNGHVNAIQTVAKKMGLNKVHVVPSFQSPFKSPVEGPTAEQRLILTERAFEQYGSTYIVDDVEVKRGGLSYTIDTIRSIKEQYSSTLDEIYLVVGADHFEDFAKWKDYQEILNLCHLIVTTRPGYEVAEDEASLPEFIKPLVADFDFNLIELKSGKSIQFITLRDIEVSSTEVRKWLRAGRPVEKYLALSVETTIKELKLYRNLGEKISDYEKFTAFCGQILFDKKAIQVRGFDLRSMSAPSEFSLVASGTSTRHTISLAENLIVAVKEEFNLHPLSIEGTEEGRWVLVDYGSLIVHVFYDFVRQEYSIEKLWKTATDLNLKDSTLP